MKVSFAKLYHAATDNTVDWPQPVKDWADADPAHAVMLQHIRALIPAHPSNATTVVALVKEVLAEMERVPEPDPHEERGKAISGKELPSADESPDPAPAKVEADADKAIAQGKAEPLAPFAGPVDRVSSSDISPHSDVNIDTPKFDQDEPAKDWGPANI